MTFVLASNNKDKLRELRSILSEYGFDVISQSDAGLAIDVEETGQSFFDNAFLKADAAMKATGLPAIADDSGLSVDFLDGGPGVRSRRYGGEGMSDDERNVLLLRNMEKAEQRHAKFVSSIVCVFPGGDLISAEGTCDGSILHVPRGTGGFGYDPVFLVASEAKSMAELTPKEKNKVSHRGNALREFRPKLEEYLLKRGEIRAER
jgi:XTP/dITP diphosphohydrolase